MTATALTKVTAARFGVGIGDSGFQSVDQPNGNSFTNTGQTIFLLLRTAAQVTPTFVIAAANATGGQTVNRAGVITGSGKVGTYGPFPVALYGTNVTVNYDTGASVTAAVVEMQENPI